MASTPDVLQVRYGRDGWVSGPARACRLFSLLLQSTWARATRTAPHPHTAGTEGVGEGEGLGAAASMRRPEVHVAAPHNHSDAMAASKGVQRQVEASA